MEQFIGRFFAEGHRNIFLVTGAGFDPRSCGISEAIAKVAAARTFAVLVREERPDPNAELVNRAEINVATLKSLFPKHAVATIPVLAKDGAVIGGREIARTLAQHELKGITDVVVDLSALSVGIGFPVVRQLFQRVRREQTRVNLHVFVADQPALDGLIESIPSDRVGPIHGFQGGLNLSQNASASKLWLPQITHTKRNALEKIRSSVSPPFEDICPILPFPAANPRMADSLIETFGDLFDGPWEVDARNLLYADEKNPVDLYRTILKIESARKRVFQGVGGSMLVLTPVGNKALAIGSLMAAMERDFPVVYVETLAYNLDFGAWNNQDISWSDVVHVWLCGEAYPDATGKAK